LAIAYPSRRTVARLPPQIPIFSEKRVPIPLEIVLNIIEAAYYDADLQPDDKLLQHCSLVCKTWSVPAQKLLFRHVTLRTQSAYSAFQLAVDRSTERGRMLGDSVVRMRVVLDHNQPFGLSQRAFAHAVTLCPNLYEMNLALYGCCTPGQDVVGEPALSRMRRPAPSFDEQSLSLLRSGPHITAFQFSNWSENQQSLNQLLNVWPTLKSLVVSGMPPQLSSASSEPLPCALRELRMNFQAPPSLDYMKWLLHNSTGTLRVLELEREPSSDLLEYLLEAHGSTIQSLALPVCGSHDHALAVQKCYQLKEFRIESPWVSPMVYRKLPRVLQHVALGLDCDTALQPVLDIVKSRESLSAVTIQVWDGGEQHPQLPALKMACAYRGIELRMTYDIRVFRTMIVSFPVLRNSSSSAH
jgi:hypothetical protein